MIAADKFFNLDFCFSDRSSKISGSEKKMLNSRKSFDLVMGAKTFARVERTRVGCGGEAQLPSI